MDVLSIALAAAKQATADPLQHWYLVVGLIGGVLLAVSLLWKGIPAVWDRVTWVRTRHMNKITASVVAALEPKFTEMRDHLDSHMAREEEELVARNRQTDLRDGVVASRLTSLERSMAGIAGALGVNLHDFDITSTEKGG